MVRTYYMLRDNSAAVRVVIEMYIIEGKRERGRLKEKGTEGDMKIIGGITRIYIKWETILHGGVGLSWLTTYNRQYKEKKMIKKT